MGGSKLDDQDGNLDDCFFAGEFRSMGRRSEKVMETVRPILRWVTVTSRKF